MGTLPGSKEDAHSRHMSEMFGDGTLKGQENKEVAAKTVTSGQQPVYKH